MGFTQRQAAGRFTGEEAAGFIGQLEDAERSADTADGATPSPRGSAVEVMLRRMPAAPLAAELQRRGWIVVEP